MSSPADIASRLKAAALALGFSDARIATAEALAEDRALLESWLAAGHHGDMAYMAEEPARRADPEALLPGARSVLALAVSYYPGDHSEPPGPASGRVARYAWGRDYHRVVGTRLARLKDALTVLAPGSRRRTFVDASPLLERAFARRAGLGFIGKNTLLIHHRLGSWVFLAAMLTDLDLPADPVDSGDCGRCRLCLDACPTDAFIAPYRLDARRCISYWTIETPAEPPPELAAKFGDWIFGCDVCQEVCPYNRRPLDTTAARIFDATRTAGPWLDAEDLAGLDDAGFHWRYKKSALTRPGRAGLAKNARFTVANLRRPPFARAGR